VEFNPLESSAFSRRTFATTTEPIVSQYVLAVAAFFIPMLIACWRFSSGS
jgi:hypothetical protein